MSSKIKESKFDVKEFQYFVEKDNQNIAVRKVVSLGDNLSWEKAKELRKQHKHSWIDIMHLKVKQKKEKTE